MKKETEFTCIVCPNGCPLQVKWEEGSADFTVSGNRCPKGKEFAVSEMTAPKRTICSTVRTVFEGVPVLPVRLSAEIPKERIFDVMAQIRKACVTKPVERGSVVVENVCGLGVDVIATSGILKEKEKNGTLRTVAEKRRV